MDKSKMLAEAIDRAIDVIDPNMQYDEFAYAVALVLNEEYGKHLSKCFISELKKYTDEMD